MANAHRSDAETAIKIGEMRPSQRIVNATLVRLIKLYARGPRSSLALQILADRSSFLGLPPGEMLAIPAPDAAKQEKLLKMARKFALGMLPQLPDLFATRTTYSFDDSPQQLKKDAWPVKAGLHLVGITKAEVNVRNEKEKIVASALPKSHRPNGLMSWGEFGSALLMVVNDSAKGTITWSHWEQFRGGPTAVFNYSVPKSASHYEIETPAEHITHIDASPRWFAATVAATNGQIPSSPENPKRLVHTRPAYHGSLWIDPATGTILRITIIAGVKHSSNLVRAATLEDYGPIRIGGRSLVCPIRSLALSDALVRPGVVVNSATTEWLNENLFTNYHLFAATTQIVGPAKGSARPPAASGKANAQPGVTPVLPPASLPASPLNTNQTSEVTPSTYVPLLPADQLHTRVTPQNTPVVPPKRPARLATTPQPPSATAPTEPTSRSAATASPAAMPLPTEVPPEMPETDTGLTLHLNVNAVLVPVAVRDKRGESVDDLKKKDFEVFDDGKLRPLSGFLVEKHAASREIENGAERPGAARLAKATPQTMAIPDRFTVFVFDDLHLTPGQISYAQKAVMKTLNVALRGSGLAAIVTTSGKINSGLTSNRAILTNAILAVRPDFLYRSNGSDCPKIDSYQADLIVNKHDPTAIADAVKQDLTVCNPVSNADLGSPRSMDATLNGSMSANYQDPIAKAAEIRVESTAQFVLQRATQGLLNTYAAIGNFVSKMAKLPGRRSMILISPGLPLVEADEKEAESRLINLADQFGVTINVLNASGVNPIGLQADDKSNVTRNPVLLAEYRKMLTQTENNAIWDLADGTGGRFFHDNNDLAAGFSEMLRAPKTVYLLELTLNGIKRNGAWHRLTVKTDRAGDQVQARRGYFAPSKRVERKAGKNGRF